jgi:hypothetical protein
MNLARVFPRRTAATPDDAFAFISPPPKGLLNDLHSGKQSIDKVHVSVTFTYDMEKAEQLAEAWVKTGLPVKLGGAAMGEPGGEFVPGRYLKHGYTITSRGCPNRCPYCSVPAREGYALRELPVKDGFNIVDDNLLACSEGHIREVFEMLKQQAEKPIFTGGLEAKLLQPWHVELLRESKTRRMYFSYDDKYSYEPLVHAGKLLRDSGFTKASQTARCYVLIGYDGDTMDNAEKRLRQAWDAGFFPFAMLFRDEKGEVQQDWQRFQRLWARPQIIHEKLKEGLNA